MAAPESAPTRAAGVVTIIIQQIASRSINTLLPQALRGDPSLRNLGRQLPSLVTVWHASYAGEVFSASDRSVPTTRTSCTQPGWFWPTRDVATIARQTRGIEGS